MEKHLKRKRQNICDSGRNTSFIDNFLCTVRTVSITHFQVLTWLLPSKHEPVIVMCVKLNEIQDLEGVQKSCPPYEDQH